MMNLPRGYFLSKMGRRKILGISYKIMLYHGDYKPIGTVVRSERGISGRLKGVDERLTGETLREVLLKMCVLHKMVGGSL